MPQSWRRSAAGSAIGLLVIGSVLACTATAPPTASPSTAIVSLAPSPTPTPTPTPSPIPMPTPTPTPTPAETLVAADLPHEAADLEALLPEEVAGRPLSRWSVEGLQAFSFAGFATEEDYYALTRLAKANGRSIDAFALATAGHTVVGSDPPYFVNAYRIGGLQGRLIPRTTGLDFPDLGTWRTVTLAGRKVAVGDDSMFDQAADSNIRPYVWNSGQVHYMIVTDDDAWAAEVIGQLE